MRSRYSSRCGGSSPPSDALGFGDVLDEPGDDPFVGTRLRLERGELLGGQGSGDLLDESDDLARGEQRGLELGGGQWFGERYAQPGRPDARLLRQVRKAPFGAAVQDGSGAQHRARVTGAVG
ncbi:hypothetical protein GCM10010231_14360 [Streptomyces sindenensis]|nr:hypothetical protein GCM10010231_14360 [Streptomyces sindenensis]